MIYVQYGCGWCAPEGWINFDASPTLRFERLPIIGKLYTRNKARFPENVRYGDIVKGLPVAAGSCDAVYCSHILEHLSLREFDTALINTHKLLKDGGTFRLVVPDFAELVREYVESDDDLAAVRFHEKSGMACVSRSRSLKAFLFSWLGNSAHLWLWDEKSLRTKLREHGFRDIRRAQFGDSTDPMFAAVDVKQRFDGCLGMECRK